MKRIIVVLSVLAILAGIGAGWTWDDHAKKAATGMFDGNHGK